MTRTLLVALAITWFVCAWWARREFLPYDVNNTDIATTLHQAQTFAAGKIWRPSPEPREFFQQYQVIVRERSYTYYPPGHALAITLPVAWNTDPWIVPWILSTLGILLMYAWASRMAGRTTAGIATCLLALSPFFAANAPSLLSHSTALFLTLLFLCAVARWQQEGGLWTACLAGLSLAGIYATRSPNAAALGAVWIPWIFWMRRDQWKKDSRLWAAFALGTAFITFPLLMYYRILGGRWRLDLFTDYWPRNKFGFGRMLGRGETGQYFQTYTNHDLHGMIENWKYNFLNLSDWWSGSIALSVIFLALAIYFLSSMIPRSAFRVPRLFPLLLWPALHILLYSLYYTPSTGFSGPRYLFEIVPALALGCGWVLSRMSSTRLGKPACVFLFLAAVIFSVRGKTFLYGQNAAGIQPRQQVEQCVLRGARPPAIVFLRSFWLGHPYPIFLNQPDLKGPILYACDRGAEDKRLVAAHPDRNAYVLDVTPLSPHSVRTELIPVYDASTRRWLKEPEKISAPFFIGGSFTRPVELSGEMVQRLFYPKREDVEPQPSIKPQRWPLVPDPSTTP